jgi:hypothetical protein
MDPLSILATSVECPGFIQQVFSFLQTPQRHAVKGAKFSSPNDPTSPLKQLPLLQALMSSFLNASKVVNDCLEWEKGLAIESRCRGLQDLSLSDVFLGFVSTWKLRVAWQEIRLQIQNFHGVDPQTDSNIWKGKATSSRSTSASQLRRIRPYVTPINGKRGSDDDEPGGGDDSGRPAAEATSNEPLQRLACPFWKHKPRHYPQCFRLMLKHIRYVKQHLSRSHSRPIHCPTCGEIFQESADLEDHIKERSCQASTSTIIPEGITESQVIKLRRAASRRQTEKEQWFVVWDIVFPGIARPSSPYVTTLFDGGLDMVWDYWQRNRGSLVREVIEAGGLRYPLQSTDRERLDNEAQAALLDQIVGNLLSRVRSDYDGTRAHELHASTEMLDAQESPRMEEGIGQALTVVPLEPVVPLDSLSFQMADVPSALETSLGLTAVDTMIQQPALDSSPPREGELTPDARQQTWIASLRDGTLQSSMLASADLDNIEPDEEVYSANESADWRIRPSQCFVVPAGALTQGSLSNVDLQIGSEFNHNLPVQVSHDTAIAAINLDQTWILDSQTSPQTVSPET